MSAKNKPEPDAEAGDEPEVSAEDVRDFFLDEQRLDVSTISQHFEIEDETSKALLDQLVQSGIIERNARRAISGGTEWTLENPQLRIRSADEVAGESPLTQQAIHTDGEPRDGEVGIEDVLETLAKYEDRRGDLTTARIAVTYQITRRRARDLADELVDRGIADKRTDPSGSDMFWLADAYTTDDVEQLLHDPEPEPDAVDQLDDALSG